MRSNILSTTALLVASLFTAVRADIAWNVLYTNDSDGRYYFLDSDNGKVVVNSANNVEAVKANHDKGMRFRWGGDDTFVTCQAHSGHMLGFDTGAQAFKADFAQSHTDALVSIHYDKAPQKAYICLGDNCIGANASPTNQHYLWYFDAVPGA